jgi:hypothetical protein
MNSDKSRVVVLGATGSIGVSTLDVDTPAILIGMKFLH